MTMKLKALATAVIAVSAGFVNTAFAHGPAVAPDLELWVSGASAQDKLFRQLLTNLCDAGTLDTFTDTAGKPEGADYSANFCTISATGVPGMSGTKKVLIHKRSRGGSAWGVAPVALAGVVPAKAFADVAIAQMDITAANCTLNDATNKIWVCAPSVTHDHISDAGISDVEPAMFTKLNLIPVGADYGTVLGDPGTYELTKSQLNLMNVTGMSAVTFGVTVTKELRDALQRAEGKTVGSEDVAQMPSLTTQQIRAIWSGAVADWSSFHVQDGVGGAWTTLDQVTTPNGVPASSGVNICRRDPGSGTQAQFNALFMNAPCVGDTLPVVTDNTPSSSHVKDGSGLTGSSLAAVNDAVPFTPVVNENAAGGDLDACMTELNTNHFWGVGVQSLTSSGNGYRFVAIDGVTPTLANVASGKYFDWAANSIQWLKPTAVGGVGAPPTGDKLKILQKFASSAANPADLASKVNKVTNIVNSGPLGALALATNGFTPDFPFLATHPVLPITRQGTDGSLSPNTCRVATVFTDSIISN